MPIKIAYLEFKSLPLDDDTKTKSYSCPFIIYS